MCVYCFFILQGNKSIIKNKIRGGELFKPEQLAKYLKKKGIASSIRIGDLPIVKDSERQHMLVSGTTGSGKTNLLNELIPQIRSRNEKAIIVDMTGSFVQQYFNPETDVLLNPFDERTANWLPWADCSTKYDYKAMAKAIVGEPALNDSFWDHSSQTIIAEALQLTDSERSIKKMLQVLSYIPLHEYSQFFRNTLAASLTDAHGDKTTLSIRATMSNKVAVFDHLSETDNPFSIKDFVLNQQIKGWLFISATPEQRDSITPLISSWVDIVLKGIMKRPVLQENPNTWLVMDELPSISKIPSLKTALAESRKYGGCIVAGIQNIHQLMAIYGQNEALSLLDQFNTRFMFRVGDQNTAQILSATLGQVETLEVQESLSFGANTIRDGVNLNTLEKKHNLVMPTEIMKLPNLSCFVKLAGNCPITKLTFKYHKPFSKTPAFQKKSKD
jgi:type IV conjugative transfer system coupling protein TraD